MNDHDRETRWTHFLTRFFASPNDLRLATATPVLENMVVQAHDAWTASAPSPFLLPALISGRSGCYAICPDDDNGVWIRDLIWAYLGSWITLRDVDSSPQGFPLDVAVVELVGPTGCQYKFTFPSDGDAPARVREGLRRLNHALASRPHRRIQLNRPLGRLIGDFWDACAAGSEAAAHDLLETLTQDHRVSRTNALFLRLQGLATFQRWDQIEALDQLPDLLRMDRPALASDALARLAMARLKSGATLDNFDHVKSQFGALVPTVTSIRSAPGAQYYTYWCLSAGESPAAVRARLHSAGWLAMVQQAPPLNGLLLEDKPTHPPVEGPLDRDALNVALADGRLDAAIALLSTAQPTADALPILHDLVLKTLSPEALDILKRWRETLDEADLIEVGTGRRSDNSSTGAHTYTSFDDAVSDAFSTSVSPEQRQYALAACRESAVAALMRPGAVPLFAQTVHEHLTEIDFAVRDLIDLLLDVERDLYAAAGDESGIQDLRFITIEMWALSDESGDRHRVSRILLLLDRLLTAGVSVQTYDGVVELLRAAWTPYLTDADTPLGLESIEILAASRPDSSAALDAFARPVLSRIGNHNARRLEPSALEAAQALAPEFDLELAFAPAAGEREGPKPFAELNPPDGTFIAIYSLMESAANRTARVLKEKYPGIRVESLLAGKVASDSLRSAAKSADILVIADRAAAHAATNALRESRGGMAIDYAGGKGTASLLGAVEHGLERLLGGSSTEAA